MNTQRLNPYKNFRVRVTWDGRCVAGFSEVRTLEWNAEPAEHRHGDDPSTTGKSRGRTTYEPVTLQRGVTEDPEFEKWASLGLRAEASLQDLRKDIVIEVYNEAGQLTLAYRIYLSWVSELRVLPDRDANAKGVAIQTLKLENEGWSATTARPGRGNEKSR